VIAVLLEFVEVVDVIVEDVVVLVVVVRVEVEE